MINKANLRMIQNYRFTYNRNNDKNLIWFGSGKDFKERFKDAELTEARKQL